MCGGEEGSWYVRLVEGELSAVSRRLRCRSLGGITRAYIGAVEEVDTVNGEKAGVSLVH